MQQNFLLQSCQRLAADCSADDGDGGGGSHRKAAGCTGCRSLELLLGGHFLATLRFSTDLVLGQTMVSQPVATIASPAGIQQDCSVLAAHALALLWWCVTFTLSGRPKPTLTGPHLYTQISSCRQATRTRVSMSLKGEAQ